MQSNALHLVLVIEPKLAKQREMTIYTYGLTECPAFSMGLEPTSAQTVRDRLLTGTIGWIAPPPALGCPSLFEHIGLCFALFIGSWIARCPGPGSILHRQAMTPRVQAHISFSFSFWGGVETIGKWVVSELVD